MDRFWSKVDRSGGEEACWPWLASRRKDGYGRFNLDGRDCLSHRVAFFLEYGHYPANDTDHTCRNRACVNPKHLEAVTRRVNMLRSPLRVKGTCVNGHALVTGNTYRIRRVDGRFYLRCLTCKRQQGMATYFRQRGAQ